MSKGNRGHGVATGRRPPPLAHIRSFECAARHRSFTRAALELGLTQAAISAHVRALESYIGVALFRRGARSLRLTETGAAFLPTLRQGLAQIDGATEAILATARERSVALACPASLAQSWLPHRLAGFLARRPEVEIVVRAVIWEEAESPPADILISILRDDEAPPDATRLWTERLALLCAPGMAARLRTAEDVAAAPKIHVIGRQEFWLRMDAALGAPRSETPGGLRTDASNVALEMAANGLGATVSLASLAEPYLRRGLLAEPFEVRPESPWSYYIRRRNARASATAAALHDWLAARAP